MTGDKNKFTSLTLKDEGNAKFGDNSKGKIIGIVRLTKLIQVKKSKIKWMNQKMKKKRFLQPTMKNYQKVKT